MPVLNLSSPFPWINIDGSPELFIEYVVEPQYLGPALQSRAFDGLRDPSWSGATLILARQRIEAEGVYVCHTIVPSQPREAHMTRTASWNIPGLPPMPSLFSFKIYHILNGYVVPGSAMVQITNERTSTTMTVSYPSSLVRQIDSSLVRQIDPEAQIEIDLNSPEARSVWERLLDD